MGFQWIFWTVLSLFVPFPTQQLKWFRQGFLHLVSALWMLIHSFGFNLKHAWVSVYNCHLLGLEIRIKASKDAPEMFAIYSSMMRFICNWILEDFQFTRMYCTETTFSFHISSSIFLTLSIDISFLGQQILAIRAQVEGLTVDEESLAYLGEIGDRTSLRQFSDLWASESVL